jgi:hypothetical protein
MAKNLASKVMKNIADLRKSISQRRSEIGQLETALKRYEAALHLVGQLPRNDMLLRRRKRARGDLQNVLAQLPNRFSTRDFMKAAAKTNKASVYLRQTLSRWAKQRRIKRVQHGKYIKLRRRESKRRVA